MITKCPVCEKAIKNRDTQFCSQCGWELTVIPENASQELKHYFEEKERRYRENIKSMQNLQKKIEEQNIQISKLKTSSQLCLITKENIVFLLEAEEYTFGNSQNTHNHRFIFDDDMENVHFALKIEYDASKTHLLCRIKNISNTKVTTVNNVKVGNDWKLIYPHDLIKAGKTEMQILTIQNNK